MLLVAILIFKQRYYDV